MDWSDLPPEILGCVFSWLASLPDLVHCALVSSGWHRGTSDSRIWRSLYFATTDAPVYAVDDKLDWRQVILRKYIFKRNLKQEKCVIRTIPHPLLLTDTNHYISGSVSGSIVGDWCTLINSEKTLLINMVTDETFEYPKVNLFLVGKMLVSSSTPYSPHRGIHISPFPEAPVAGKKFNWIKLPLNQDSISIVHNGDSTSDFVGFSYVRPNYYGGWGLPEVFYWVYNLNTMENVCVIPDTQHVRHPALYKQFLLYHRDNKVHLRDLITKESWLIKTVAYEHEVLTIGSGYNQFVIVQAKQFTVLNLTTKKHVTVPSRLTDCNLALIFNDMVVAATSSKVVFLNLSTGAFINAIDFYDNIEQISEMSTGELAVRTAHGVRVMAMQDKIVNKRIKLQAIQQLENRCLVQEVSITASELINYIGQKNGEAAKLMSYHFNVGARERFGIIYSQRVLGTPTKQKLRNNYASKFLKKSVATQGYLPYIFTRSLDYNYNPFRSASKPAFIDGNAFLYYERFIDGHWELSTPKEWPKPFGH